MSVPATIGEVLEVVCRRYGVSLHDLKSDRRNHRILKPRHIAMHLSKKVGDKTFAQIGRAFVRDHTTILSATQRMEERLARDPELLAEVEELEMEVLALAQLRDRGVLRTPMSKDPYVLAKTAAGASDRFVMSLSVEEIRGLCEEIVMLYGGIEETPEPGKEAPPALETPVLLETPVAIQPARPQPLADLVHDFLSIEASYRKRPNAALRIARDKALATLDTYARDPRVREALAAHAYLTRAEFTTAERDAFERYDAAIKALAKFFSETVEEIAHG